MNGGQILVSSMSAWELAMLAERGRVALSMDIESWLDTLTRIDALQMVPVGSEIAVKSVQLPGDFHQDPADRIIVATARKFAAPWPAPTKRSGPTRMCGRSGETGQGYRVPALARKPGV